MPIPEMTVAMEVGIRHIFAYADGSMNPPLAEPRQGAWNLPARTANEESS